ncbi:Aryl hydrocarbon receptor nuclear translocator-like protein 1 [Wickerhamomyces ciferrii]|uniref:Aryl hydrocarbon receptor nuclear translocator-like protein 1 n=1 Tax=Wickerhamomyces ciferrii (strain ATCC 14091 / BCRC 22168 / CBS 111 / JCM 3599 / NBRC 0793 / NRRL Y-1031 F-60-10) TaxID=1206466 RepID=K0KHC2_WICCF|nr:Aryl hydrocarbon receptor nuclear translocator-like protein 1 [Wickerhamomyces ciferrii]CCH40568.1 Aryl hydrocarbon receptor nuclear translocator-like protein 1 [Wickerhamomyces ciferrii]
MSLIPSPPDLKPTIIQMQNNDDDLDKTPNVNPNDPKSPLQQAINSNSSQSSSQSNPNTKRKRRRSSSSLISQNEIEKRRREHKTAHSIIEKKRRIRMNREFESLKFLIPACRNNLTTSNNNGEGMYKLTILQATVDYIKYLHQVINIQNDEILKFNPNFNDQEDLNFAKININTDLYRNLDNDFNFNKLFEEFNQSKDDGSSSVNSSFPKKTIKNQDLSSTKSQQYLEPTKFEPLPSPLITPELFPNQSSSSSSTPFDNYKTINPNFQFQSSTKSTQSTPLITPTTKPITSTNTTTSSTQFQLPKPALSNHSSISSTTDSKLSMIQEFTSFQTDPDRLESSASDASNVLLAMKRDRDSSVASIRSLLN